MFSPHLHGGFIFVGEPPQCVYIVGSRKSYVICWAVHMGTILRYGIYNLSYPENSVQYEFKYEYVAFVIHHQET